MYAIVDGKPVYQGVSNPSDPRYVMGSEGWYIPYGRSFSADRRSRLIIIPWGSTASGMYEWRPVIVIPTVSQLKGYVSKALSVAPPEHWPNPEMVFVVRQYLDIILGLFQKLNRYEIAWTTETEQDLKDLEKSALDALDPVAPCFKMPGVRNLVRGYIGTVNHTRNRSRWNANRMYEESREKLDYSSLPSPQRIAERIREFNEIYRNPDTRSQYAAVWNSPIKSYREFFHSLVSNINIPYDELLSKMKALYRAQSVMWPSYQSIPWPHRWFDIITTLNGFYGGFNYFDPNLALSNYFPKTQKQVTRDIAQFIIDHNDEMASQFETRFRAWVKEKQKEAEEEADRHKILGYVVAVVGAAVSIVTGGLLAPVVVGVVQSMVTVASTKHLTDEQKATAEKIYGLIGTTQEKVDNFQKWIALNASAPPTPQAPPTPVSEYRFSVLIEDRPVATGNSADELVQAALGQAKVGDRIILKDESTGEVIGVILMTKEGAKQVPKEDMNKVLALSPSTAGKVSGKSNAGLIAAVVAIPAIFFATR